MKKFLFLALFSSLMVFGTSSKAQINCELIITGSTEAISPNGDGGFVSVEMAGVECDLEAQFYEDVDGNIGVEVWGGTPPYVCVWNNGSSNLLVDYYEDWCVTVVDANACTLTLCEEATEELCGQTLYIYDAVGDGWNGASVDVYVNGSYENTVTILEGASGNDDINTFPGDLIEFVWTSGESDEEISWELYGADATTFVEGGLFGDVPQYYAYCGGELEPIECALGPAWVETTPAIDCVNGQFYLSFGFESSNTSEYFNVYGNGNEYGSFYYGQDFYELDPFEGNGQAMELVIVDGVNEDCQTEVVFNAPNCNEGNLECNAAFEWSMENNTVLFYNNSTPEFLPMIYSVQYVWDFGDGNTEQTTSEIVDYSYAESGEYEVCLSMWIIDMSENTVCESISCQLVTIGEGTDCIDESQIDETWGCIEIWDPVCGCDEVTYSDECFAQYYGGVTSWTDGPCGEEEDCEINNLWVELTDCEEGMFYVYFGFESNNTSDYFGVYANGEDYGTFYYGQPYYMIGPFVGNGQGIELVVIDGDSPNNNCSAEAVFDTPDCGGGNDDCEIWDVFAEAWECNEDGFFYVDVAFQSNNTAEQFQIVGNGANYGIFSYGEQFYTLGPLVGDGSTVYEFVIQDLESPNCSDWTALGPVNCEGCLLSNLSFQFNMDNNGDVECSDAGTYQATIDFDYQNVSEWGFDVFYNGEPHSFHSYAELPLTLELAAESALEGGSNSWLEICNNDDESCCLVYGYPIPCQDGQTNVEDLISETVRLYPNPVREQLFIDYSTTQKPESLRLLNALGQQLLIVNLPEGAVPLSIPNGYYIVELLWELGAKTRHPLIKE